jgi:hypothetical protein
MYLSNEGISIGWRTSPAIIAIRKRKLKEAMYISSECNLSTTQKYRGRQAINATLLPGNLGPRKSSASPPGSGEKRTNQTEQTHASRETRLELTAIFTEARGIDGGGLI